MSLMSSSSCPGPDLLQGLLDDSLPTDRRLTLTRHLDECEHCRQALENLASPSGAWSMTARHLAGRPPPLEGALQQLLERLQHRPRLPPTMLDDSRVPALDFLGPSQNLGELGRLGRYEVRGIIGIGGMGIVFEAVDPALNRTVAIKVMAAPLATNATARRRFTREAQAAAAVKHDHVVTIHGVEEANGLPCIVMEYVRGTSLQDVLDGGPLESERIVRIGMETAAGLAAAHAEGLVHRDIKPANLLIEAGTGRVKITDFGLARAVDDASLTQSGVIAGTPQYMAPEQARAEPVDHRADLFSLGSVLYALCTGRPPFEASSSLGVLKCVCEERPRPIREISPAIPRWLAAMIDRLHAKDPAQRFQSASEVAELFRRRLAGLPDEMPARRRFLGVAVAVVLALAGGLVVGEATGISRLFRPAQSSHAGTRQEEPPAVVPDEQSVVMEPEFVNSVGMKMRRIPAGTFQMGSPESEIGRDRNESLHAVDVRPFCIGVYEVTQDEYQRVMGENPSWFAPDGEGASKVAGLETDRFPVECVSWNDAAAFCRKLSEMPGEKTTGRVYHLPTEEQWEYACRAGTETAFHTGNGLSTSQANFDGGIPGGADSLRRTATVGSCTPNAWGLYDMHGNVWEWCQDGAGDNCLLRGGSWFSKAAACRSASRNHRQPPGTRSRYIGFRVVCEEKQP
jgi:formylglycine-generating enzyme required for sulfatase activity/predicted Ser/Thr protein kinase